jgi:hypothetical protein
LIKKNKAMINRNQTNNHVEAGGFTGTVRAQQANDLTAFYIQGNIFNDLAVTVTLRQLLRG